MKDCYKILDYLEGLSKKKIAPTRTDYAQFEKNIYHSWLVGKYEQILQNLHQLKVSIGSEVWPYKGRFGYSLTQSSGILNKTEDLPVILTQTMYDKYEVDYLTFIVERFSEELVTQSPRKQSTSEFGNLVMLIEIEAKQDLVKELKELLRG